MQKFVNLDQIKTELNHKGLSKFLINLSNTNQVKDVFNLLQPISLTVLDQDLRFLKLRLYILNTKFPELIEAIDSFFSDKDGSGSIDEIAYFHAIKGRALLDLNRHDDARKALELADKLIPMDLIEKSKGTDNHSTYVTRKAGIKVFWGISDVYKSKLDDAMSHLQQAIILYDGLGNKVEIAGAQMVMGIIYIQKGEFVKAKEILLKCLETFEEFNDLNQQGHTHINLGIIYIYTKELDIAEKHQLQAKSLYEKSGFERGVINVLTNLSETYTTRGKYFDAIQMCNQVVDMSKEKNIVVNLVDVYTNMAKAHRRLGNFDKAETSLLLALDYGKNVGMNRQVLSTLVDLGKQALHLGKYKEAKTYYETLTNRARELALPRHEGIGLTYLGVIDLLKGDLISAQQYLLESFEIEKKEDDPEIIANTLRYLGYLHFVKSDFDEAERYYSKSFEKLRPLGNEYALAEILSNLIWIGIEKQDSELVSKYIEEFEKLIPTAEGPIVKEIYDLIMCKRDIIQNKFDDSIEQKLIDLHEKGSFEYSFRIKAIFLLMEIKVRRFEQEKSIDILNELSFWKDELKLLASEQNLIKLNIDSLIFESKIELAKCEITKAHQILDEALNLIVNKELNLLENEIQDMKMQIDEIKIKICETNISSYSVEELLVITKITNFIKEIGSWGAYPSFKL